MFQQWPWYATLAVISIKFDINSHLQSVISNVLGSDPRNLVIKLEMYKSCLLFDGVTLQKQISLSSSSDFIGVQATLFIAEKNLYFSWTRDAKHFLEQLWFFLYFLVNSLFH